MRKALILLALVAAALLPATAASGQEDDNNQECHPGYQECLPIVEDIDCAGGTGDGPEFVEGPVTVVGEDEYGLDGDGDGVGCENGENGAPAPQPEAPAPPVEAEPDFTG